MDFIWEDHIHYPDDTFEIEYRIERHTFIIPRFQRCEQPESFLAPFRWN